MKIQVMLDEILCCVTVSCCVMQCEIWDSIDKINGDLQETRQKLCELESRQDGFEEGIVNLREDTEDGKKHVEYEILTLKDKINDLENRST